MARAKTVGSWGFDQAPIHFLSGDIAAIYKDLAKGKTSVREVPYGPFLWSCGRSDLDTVMWLQSEINQPLLIDSGCFTLASKMDILVREMSNPEDSPLWPKVWPRWKRIMTSPYYLERVWGVIEVDGGSPEDKTRRRERHEDITGTAAIPVFHMHEPWEYLHKLVDGYDRVAVGRSELSDAIPERLNRFWAEIETRFGGSNTWFHYLAGHPYQQSFFRGPVPQSSDSTSWFKGAMVGGGFIRVSTAPGGNLKMQGPWPHQPWWSYLGYRTGGQAYQAATRNARLFQERRALL